MKYEQTTFDRLRAGARESKDPVYEDYEKYLEDTTKLRIGCGLFMFLVLIVIVVGLSLLGAR